MWLQPQGILYTDIKASPTYTQKNHTTWHKTVACRGRVWKFLVLFLSFALLLSNQIQKWHRKFLTLEMSNGMKQLRHQWKYEFPVLFSYRWNALLRKYQVISVNPVTDTEIQLCSNEHQMIKVHLGIGKCWDRNFSCYFCILHCWCGAKKLRKLHWSLDILRNLKWLNFSSKLRTKPITSIFQYNSGIRKQYWK